MNYEKYKEEMSLSFYSQLKTAQRKHLRVSINAVGFKNLTGYVKSIQKYAVMLDRGDGITTIIAMPSIRMITIYSKDEDNTEGEDSDE